MTTSPIRVSSETDERISQASALLGMSKKAFVDEAVNEYVESRVSQLSIRIKEVADLFELPVIVSASSMERVAKLNDSPAPPTPAALQSTRE
ncbi:MAG: hypothetical protein WEA29_03070 [Acidimicrobiia bacterium]